MAQSIQAAQTTRAKRNEIGINILKAVGLTGILVAGAVCPNLLQLLRPYARKQYAYPSYRRAVKAVDTKGWIVAEKTSRGVDVYLTKRGRAELLAYELGKKRLKNKGRWDGIWHLLIFDIPEKRKYLRETVRRVLKNMGFHRLQDSVWVYPYDCREILNLLQIRYGIKHEALYVSANHIDNDRWLRRHFGLKTD